MSEFKLTTVEEFEEATARLLETGAKVGGDVMCGRMAVSCKKPDSTL